jgi:peptide chain release factor 2
MTLDEIKKRITEIEATMADTDFWSDKVEAKRLIKELQDLKTMEELGPGAGKYDAGAAIMTIFSGAGGDDSEDFSSILLNMYRKFIDKKGWGIALLHENTNDHGGYRNVTIEISGKNVYGTLKNESGVHRLVRISPFSAKKLRHTSFSMVEVIPKFEKTTDMEIPDDEMEISIAKSGGPGGQNVNKRETAVRIVHLPTKLSVHVTSERSQAQNKEKALEILRGKLYALREEERIKKEKGMYVSKTTDIEWGNQIRSYVMHPYKMVKDHRTNVEIHNIDEVLDGNIEPFIEAEKSL